MIDYVFCFPPSVNTMYMQGKSHGQKFATKKLKEFKKSVKYLYPRQTPRKGPLAITLYLYPPDKRVRDLDNYIKASLDGLTHIGAIVDDCHIKSINAYMGKPIPRYNKGLVYIVVDDGIDLDEYLHNISERLDSHLRDAPEALFIKRSKVYDKKFGGTSA